MPDRDDTKKPHCLGVWALLRALCIACVTVLVSSGCSHPPPGRYVIDAVDIDRVILPGVDPEGVSRGVPESAITDKIATAASPRFLAVFPQGVVLDFELFDPYVLERDLARIQRIYRARGYYEAQVRAGRVERTDEGHVRVHIIVHEGARVDVGDIRIDGIVAVPIDDAAAVFARVRRSLKKGRAFDEDRFEKAQKDLLLALADRGYAFAEVKGAAEVDLNRHVADVVLTVTPGETARLGPVTIKGLGVLPEEPVRRALDLSQGELYSASKLDAARQAVLSLGVFSDVEVVPVLTDKASRTVPVEVRVSPSDLREVKLGGGIELDTLRADMHLLTGWEDRNFLGGLRRLTLDLRPGVVLFPTRIPTNSSGFQLPENYLIHGRARAELRQPGFVEARTYGVVRGEFNMYPVIFPPDQSGSQPSNWVLGYRDISTGLGLDRLYGAFYANLFYNLQANFPFAYIFQDAFPYAYFGDVPLPMDGIQRFKKIVLSYVELKTNLDFRNDPVLPHKGIFISNDFQVAGVPVTPNFRGPNVLFPYDLKVQPEIRGYIPIRRSTLAMRLTVGFLFPQDYGDSFASGAPTLDADDSQQIFFRGFFSGGPNSNRGYPFRGVGSKGPLPFFIPGISPTMSPNAAADCAANPDLAANSLGCNFPTGGLSLWETSVELRVPLAGEFGGALFCDASDVSRYRLNIRVLYPHLSCGVGAHYNTPVGPVRLDFGVQIPKMQVLDPEATEADKASYSSYAVSVGIGEAF